ncbi:hypothetical protein ACLOJK_017181 [Asimina triloba]
MKVAAAIPESYFFLNSTPQNFIFSFSFSKSPPVSSLPYSAFSQSPSDSRRHRRIRAEAEIRVCVNRSCSRSGSRQTLEILSDLAPPGVSVNSCGCLGRCGAGPNLVLLPGAVFVGHCGTAARAADVLAEVCRDTGGFDASKNLEALALRKRGEGELEKGNFSEAEVFLSQAIDLKPSGGLHVIYKCRSSARLGLGNNSGALEDAKEASRIAPQYPQAYISEGDALVAMEEFDAAEEAYSSALSIDPSIGRSKSFKVLFAFWINTLDIGLLPIRLLIAKVHAFAADDGPESSMAMHGPAAAMDDAIDEWVWKRDLRHKRANRSVHGIVIWQTGSGFFQLERSLSR